MSRLEKSVIWIIGFIILMACIQFPIENIATTWSQPSTLLEGKIIVLDPGHGGVDGGAVGKDGTNEKEITLHVAKQLRQYLEQAGAVVYLTRESDVDLAEKGTRGLSKRKSEDIRNRLQFIHEKDADLFLSIHLNSLVSSKWSGAQTFYYNRFSENESIATFIQDALIRHLKNTTRTPLEINYMYLLKHAEIPGALVELGFLSNDRELQLLKTKSYQQKLAASIYKGILYYMKDQTEETLEQI